MKLLRLARVGTPSVCHTSVSAPNSQLPWHSLRTVNPSVQQSRNMAMFGSDWIKRPLEKIFGSYKTREELEASEPTKETVAEKKTLIEEDLEKIELHGGQSTPWDSPSFVKLQKVLDARRVPPAQDIDAALKEIVAKHVDIPAGMESRWHEFEFADLSAKFRIVTDAAAHFNRSISSRELTNLLSVQDLATLLATPPPPNNRVDSVQLYFAENRNSLPPNVCWVEPLPSPENL